MSTIAAVTFDLWHTLVKESPGSTEKVSELRVRRIGQVLESAGRPHPAEELEDAYDKTSIFLEQLWRTEKDMPARDHVVYFLDQIESGLSESLGPEDMDAIERIYAEAMLQHPPVLVDGAERVLNDLARSGLALGLISNTGKTPGVTLRRVLDRMGVLSFFRSATFSDETMIRKPDETIFLTTLAQMGAVPEATVHVGDDPKKDVEGARACGMMAIQVAWPGVLASHKANRFVSALAEVPDAIRELDKGLSARQELHR